MLDNFIYVNHLGIRFSGLENGVYLNYNTLRDYSWSHDTINSRISRFYRPITNHDLPLIVKCATDAEAVRVKNRLLEIAEADIEARLPGKVYVGEYYINGYITGSKKSDYLITKQLCGIQLTLTCDDAAWYWEQTHVFKPDTGGSATVGSGTDYAYDYAYDYALSLTGRTIVCNSTSPNHFRLRIYGAAVDPTVVIAGHTYAIKGTVGANESLLIDGLNKTITLTTASGQKVNWFDKRVRDSYIFEPIPPGQNTVSWLGNFGFDLTVIEKRSEPKWT